MECKKYFGSTTKVANGCSSFICFVLFLFVHNFIYLFIYLLILYVLYASTTTGFDTKIE